MKISVIMPVNLEYYEFGSFKSASKAESKFLRSVYSFIDQSFTDAELIIVADGCWKTRDLYELIFNDEPNIKFKYIEKQIKFSGAVRQTGLDIATGEIICYLDHDDIFGEEHLAIINENFDADKFDWVYYNDYLVKNKEHTIMKERNVEPIQNSIGTSSVAHKRGVNVLWGDGYGHDFKMIQDCLLNRSHTKIPTPQYYVCHCSGLNMDF